MAKKKEGFFESIKNLINSGTQSINQSQFFIAIVMLLMNIGSKYIAINFSKTQEAYLKAIMGRHVVIFCVAFMATRNLIISLLVLLVFVILADYAFNENSRFCILPQTMRDLKDSLDTDGDGKISQKEIEDALKVLKDAKKNKEKRKQIEAFTKFKSLVNI